MFSVESMALGAVWLICIIYFSSILPQIFLNYKLRSVTGLSNLMLFGLLIGYIAETYYVECLYLPNGYRVMLPLGIIAAIVLCFQKIYFEGLSSSKGFLNILVGIIGISFFFLPLAFKNLSLVGNIAGWIGAFIWSTYKLPQVAKLYKSKSVYGFSFFFVLILWVGSFLEFIAAMILKLPGQTIFNGLYGIIVNSVLMFQFFLYRNN